MTAAVRAALVAAVLIGGACSFPGALVDNLVADCRVAPAAPLVGGTTVVDLTLRMPDGAPVIDAAINLEGHMAHPGMAPVIAALAPQGDGHYRASLVLTMAGDWQLVVNGRLADGRIVRQQVADIRTATTDTTE